MTAEPTSSRRGALLAALVAVVVLLSAGAWTLVTLPPPLEVDAQSAFDTDRAVQHVQFIASGPRPLGAPHHRAVREYLVNEFQSMGLFVEVQDARVSHPRVMRGLPVQVMNVVARLPGTGGGAGKAVMLAAHYDSTHLNAAASHGAGDDGAAVAALLEVARVLTDEPPANDVIFLITDGEERGLLGARAFVNEHPWLAHVGVVFNFEARGTSGPSLMFQTSTGNGWLIDQFSRAAPHPRTSSIGYEIYRLMPNNTDFTIFRDAGLQGLNFAFIGDYHNYHRAGDTIENLDVRSLRHHGVQALALARHFGELDLDPLPQAGDAIYFNVGSLGVVRYPQRWARGLAIVATVASLGALVIRQRRGDLRARGVLWSSLILLINLALAVAVAWGVVSVVPLTSLDRQADRAIAGFTVLTALCTAIVLWILRRRTSAAELAAVGLLLWTILTVASAALVPAASYLLVWPTLAGAAGMLLVSSRPLVNGVLVTLVNLPLLLLLTPVIYLAFLGLRLRLAPAVVVVIVIALWMLVPQLLLIGRTPRADAGAEPPPRGKSRSDAPDLAPA